MGWMDDYKKALKKLKEEDEQKLAKSSKPTSSSTKKPTATGSSWMDEYYAELDRLEAEEEQKNYQTKMTVGSLSSPQKEEDDGFDFFQKGVFEDGWQFGDGIKAILGTTADLGVGVVKGASKLAGGIVDAGAYGMAAISEAVGDDDLAERLRKKAQENTIDDNFKGIDEYLDKYSVLGKTSDSVAEGLGQVAGILLTGGAAGALGASAAGVSAVTTGAMGLSSFGSGMSEAYQSKEGITDEEAATYGLIKGVVDAGSELIFGGLGKTVKALGLSKGLSSLDDVFAQKLTSKITNQVAKNFVEFGVKASAEGVEEVLAGIGSAVGKKLTYMKDEELSQLLKDENLLEQFVVGAVTSGISQSGLVPGMKGGSLKEANQTGRDFISGLSENEQKVVDKEFENRLSEAGELTKKEQNELYERVLRDMEKGYISTDTIEEVLGGDSYQEYKSLVDKEDAEIKRIKDQLAELEDAPSTVGNNRKYDALQAQLEEIENSTQRDEFKQKFDEAFSERIKGDRLVESYNEVARRKQKFEADLTKFDKKYHATIQRAIDSGVLNNTNRSHELVEFAAKLEADKGYTIDFTNNKKIQETSFAVDGKIVNGYKTDSGIAINVQSPKYLESTIGHEITHVLEGTDFYDSLKETIFEYAKSKGEYDSRLQRLTELYKDMDADVEAELAADLVGDYIFTDADFVKRLSADKNLFQKIYDEIKYFCKIVTAGSEEARKLEEVKRVFEKAYQSDVKATGKTQHSLSPEQEEYFKDSKVRDENGNLKAVYHGSPKDFNTFSLDYLGTNGTAEGYGFYFTDKKNIAEGYSRGYEGQQNGEPGRLFEVYLDIKKPLSDTEVTMTRAQFKKFLTELNNYVDADGERLDVLSNYGDVEWEGLNKVLNYAMEIEYDGSDSDVNLVHSIINGCGDMKAVFDVLRKTVGYDGIIVNEASWGGDQTIYIAFHPEQIKNVDNEKPTTNPDIRYSLSEDTGKVNDQYSPVFYSHMAKVVDGVKQNKLGASSVVNMLRGKGVKAEEIKWSGIEEWLEGKKSVTKEELQEFVKGSMLQIEETVHDNETVTDYMDMETGEIYSSVDEMMSVAYDKAAEMGFDEDDVRSDYNGNGWQFWAYKDGVETELLNVRTSTNNLAPTRWQDYKLGGGTNYREFVFSLPGNNHTNQAMQVHWGESAEGILAHARVQDFDTPDGKMLFIEEIQSDWHNEGHNVGYSPKDAGKKLAALEGEAFKLTRERFDMYNPLLNDLTEFYRNYGMDTPELCAEKHLDWSRDGNTAILIEAANDAYKFPEGLQTRLNRYFELEHQENVLARKGRELNRGIPDAPFHENYHEFVLKSLIRQAAEQGYDSIGWTTADIQSERWSGEYAEGYRIEYDQDIPKFLNKYGKKWGAQVGKTNIGASSFDIPAETEVPAGMDDDMWLLREEMHFEDEGTEVWTMPITEAMKQSVLYEGQPLYSLSEEGEAPYGRGTLGKDVAYEEEAPIADNTASNTENVLPNAENVLEPEEVKSPANLAEIAKQARRDEFKGAYTHEGKQYLSDGSFIAEFSSVDDSLDQSEGFPIKMAVKELDEAFERQTPGNYNLHAEEADGYVKVGDSLFDVKYINALIRAFDNPVFSISNERGGHHALLVSGDNGRAVLMPVRAGDNANVVYEAQQTADVLPDNVAPIQSELESLYQEQAELENRMREMGEDVNEDEAAEISNRYMEVLARIGELEGSETERVESLGDEDVPAEAEDVSAELAPLQRENPFDTRDPLLVSNRSANAFIYDNPEFKEIFQQEANIMLGELQRTDKGKRLYNDDLYYQTNGEQGFMGQKRNTSESIEELLDGWGMSYVDIESGLRAILRGDDSMNYAAAKKIEFVINDRLANGYTDFDTNEHVPANEEYLKMLDGYSATQTAQEAAESLGDADAPLSDEYLLPSQEVEKLLQEDKDISNFDGFVIERREVTRDGKTYYTYAIRTPDKQVIRGRTELDKTAFFNKAMDEINLYKSGEHPIGKHFQKFAAHANDDYAPMFDDMGTDGDPTPPVPPNDPSIFPNKKTDSSPNGQVAKILPSKEVEKRKKFKAWEWAKEHILDHGMIFEDLSKETGNRALEEKWDFIRKATARGQHLIGKGAGDVKALKDIRRTVLDSGLYEQFEKYMYHKHNMDRMTLKARGLGENKPVFGNPVTWKVSADEVLKYEANHPEFMEWAQDIYDYNSYLREMLVESGYISQETADLWEFMYPHYVPIRRDGKGGFTFKKDKGVGGTPLKGATGGSANIMDMFDTIGDKTIQYYRMAARNSFGIELKNTLQTQLESDSATLEDLMAYFDSEDSLLKPGENGMNPTFTVFEDGQRIDFQITEEMYESLKPRSAASMYRAPIVSAWSELFRKLTTEYNPAFMLTNPIKDLQDILLNSQHPMETAAYIGNSVWQQMRNGYWYREYMENGGEQNSFFNNDTSTFDDTKKNPVQKFLDRVSWLNNHIEMTPRLAEYIVSRGKGKSIEAAMLDASRVTTNFSAGGDWAKFMNANGATFLNASIQGAVQQARNVREAHEKGFMGYVGLLARMTMAGIPAVLLNGLWEDDEDYEQLADYVKENYYIVKKTDDGRFIRIPKGRAVAVIQDAVDKVMSVASGDEELDLATFLELAGDNLKLAAENVAPNNPLDNNIVAPLFQVWRNESWYDEEIVSSRLQKLPKEEQFDEKTDKLSIKLGEMLNMSPKKINYLLNQYSGGIGDMILPMMTPKAESPDDSWYGNLLAPVRDKFVTDGVMNSQVVTDFRDKQDELTINANGKNATDEDKMKALYLDTISYELNDLYAQKREIQMSDKPNSEKYELTKELQQQINEAMEEALSSYQDVKIDGMYSEVGDRRFNYDSEKDTWYEIRKKNADGSDNYYYQQERKAVQTFGIDSAEYWNNREDYDDALYYATSYGKNLSHTAHKVFGASSFAQYGRDLSELKADYDSKGNAISGSKKDKVIDYCNSMDADYGEKIILFKSQYPKDDTYNDDIIDYLNEREDLNYNDKKVILEELGFKVSSDGRVTWD